jgi:uncharacterized protein YkwD
MHAKWNLFLFVILFSIFTGLIDASHHLLLKSITVDISKNVLGTSATIPSQVGDIRIIAQKYIPTPTPQKPTGNARKIDDVTWTVDVPKDNKQATSAEILSALNAYRQKKGQSALSWDNSLGDYAQSRATGFSEKNALDGHAGFLDYINNQDGFKKLGFSKLGENSSIGFVNGGTNLIEQVYGQSPGHDENQLSSKWSHVGIGTSGTASNLVFGGGRL